MPEDRETTRISGQVSGHRIDEHFQQRLMTSETHSPPTICELRTHAARTGVSAIPRKAG